MKWDIEAIVEECREYCPKQGEAIYTDGYNVWPDDVDCQDSGSYCVVVGWHGYTPKAVDWHNIADVLEAFEAIDLRAAYSPRD